MSGGLTHDDDAGQANMVDVSEKPATLRTAVAEGFISASQAALEAVKTAAAAKGDVLAAARIAGIAAAKRTADLIPLCHPLAVTFASVDITMQEQGFHVVATVKARDCTGVEMESLTAVSVACLTLYDMLKAVDREMTIGAVRLVLKTGGRSR